MTKQVKLKIKEAVQTIREDAAVTIATSGLFHALKNDPDYGPSCEKLRQELYFAVAEVCFSDVMDEISDQLKAEKKQRKATKKPAPKGSYYTSGTYYDIGEDVKL